MGASSSRVHVPHVTGPPLGTFRVYPLLALYGLAKDLTADVNAAHAAGRPYRPASGTRVHVFRWVMPHNMYTK